MIFSAGFYHSKARHLKGLGRKIVESFNGQVPATIEELTSLPGVGRKTANVVLGHAFDIPVITVDTHFGRLSRRFGWTTSMDPVKVEHEGRRANSAERVDQSFATDDLAWPAHLPLS